MIRKFAIFTALFLTGCAYGYGGAPRDFPEFQPRPGQGQYVRPVYLTAELPPRLPPADDCQSQLYQGLLGRHEGAIFMAGLPGRKRVIKPAELEGFGYEPDDTFYDRPPFVEVREYLAGQSIYAPSVSNVVDRMNLGPTIEERLTIELDDEGIVETVDCR